MELTVRFFAAFRDMAGESELRLRSEAHNPRALFEELMARYPGLSHQPAALVAINDEMADWESPLSEGDEVLLFPPVAGG